MKGRIVYIDVLNVISCIAVVCMHSNGFVHTFIKDDWWWFRVLVEVLCYFAVPVFFMLTGATLMEYRKKYTTKEFYKKRFLKTFVPFVFWGIVFYMLYYFTGHKDLDWQSVVMNVTRGQIPYTNYWFFIPLFMIYIFMPFLSLMVVNMSRKSLLALCVLLFVFQSLLPTLYSVMGLEFQVSLPIGGYFIFVLLGYYMETFDIEKNNRILILLGGAGLMSIIFRYLIVYYSDIHDAAMFTYMGIYVFFPAMYIFLYIKKKNWTHAFWTKLSRRSFGVYLIHTVFIAISSKYIDWSYPLFVPIAAVSIYSLSVLIISLLQNNKVLRVLVP